MSPDPLGNAVADPTNPQSWNMYSYVLNNPLGFVDPTGYDWCQWDDGTHDDNPDDGGATQQQCSDQGGTWIPTFNQTITVNGNTGDTDYSSDLWTPDNGTLQQPQVPSWWGTFAKNFFGNFVSLDFYKSEFSSNGCLNTFVSASVDALNPASPSLAGPGGAGTMAASAAMRYNAAQAYAASRTNVLGGQGLIFPQKSIPYNNIMEGSAVTNLAEGGLGYVDGALFQGVVTEAQAAFNGTCH